MEIPPAQTKGLGGSAITFRPVTREDFPRLYRWLVNPAVQAWWRSDTRTVGDVEREYGPQVDGSDATRSFLILVAGQPTGMIQCYRHADYPSWQEAVGVPSAAGIDYLIGEDGQRGRGIGSAAIAAFTAVVFGLYPEVDWIVSVPQRDNRASCRALEKAGFTLLEERELNSGHPSDAGIGAVYGLARMPRHSAPASHQIP
jgi:RimJ/RimL family protein N-acetyltransferase